MDDRELLELAAKAAGFQVKGWVGDALWFYDDITNSLEGWNPLTNDGDALRLAVKLYLFDGSSFKGFRSEETWANPDREDYEITRRAIVRAAAEIGKTL